jgi:hypothetical protein
MQILPLIPSVTEYTFDTVLDDLPYFFRVYWNDRDEAWYLDVYDGGDRTPVAYGIKVVLGTNLGRTHDHPLTRQGLLVAIDRSGENRDATFDDLGDRVIVMHVTQAEFGAAIVAAGGA